MKHIKTFEYKPSLGSDMLNDSMKLLNSVTKVFVKLGYGYKEYYFEEGRRHENRFYKNGTYDHLPFHFNISCGYDSKNIYFYIETIANNDMLVKNLPVYFKTINGLKLYDVKFFTTKFKVVGNIDNIINQIPKTKKYFEEDFKFRINSNKYNL